MTETAEEALAAFARISDMKRCTACGSAKDPEEFHRDSSRSDGRKSRCRECENAGAVGRRAANPEAARSAVRRWREANLGRDRECTRQWREANVEALADAHDRYRDELRDQVFGHYGHACVCCGAIEDLTIDHVNGDGKQHREELFGSNSIGGIDFYRWLIAQGFPDGYQVLCRPCNASKFQGAACRLLHQVRADAGD